MKNNLVDIKKSEHIFKKNEKYSYDFFSSIGKKIELSFKNQEPVIGILNRCDGTDVELRICNQVFMINRNEIAGVRNIEPQKNAKS